MIAPDPRADEVAAEYARWHLPIVAFLTKRCGDPDLAEDLAQHAWVKSYERWHQFREVVGPGGTELPRRAWLYQIAHNVWRDHRRRAGLIEWRSLDHRVGADGLIGFAEPEAPDDVEGEVLAREARAEAARQVAVALARLAPGWRAVLELWCRGLSYAAIAAARGVGVISVKSQLHRAREAFRVALDAPAVIRRRREALGLTQRELARRCGVSQSYLCDIERGKWPAPRTVRRVLEAIYQLEGARARWPERRPA